LTPVLVVGTCFAVTACGSQAPTLLQAFNGRADGISARYPAGWRLSTRNDSYVPNPALCFRVSSKDLEIKLVEYLPPALTHSARSFYPRRPKRFRVGMLRRGDNDWTAGKTLDFQERGRVFYVGVVFGRRSGRGRLEDVEAVLDSIRVEAGRCRPSAGVGALRSTRG
jgi:hypothetical protein